MKIKISIAIVWALLAALFFYCTSCSRAVPQSAGVKYFQVISKNDSTFIARSGKLEAMFFTVDCSGDSIYVGKIIRASRANILK